MHTKLTDNLSKEFYHNLLAEVYDELKHVIQSGLMK